MKAMVRLLVCLSVITVTACGDDPPTENNPSMTTPNGDMNMVVEDMDGEGAPDTPSDRDMSVGEDMTPSPDMSTPEDMQLPIDMGAADMALPQEDMSSREDMSSGEDMSADDMATEDDMSAPVDMQAMDMADMSMEQDMGLEVDMSPEDMPADLGADMGQDMAVDMAADMAVDMAMDMSGPDPVVTCPTSLPPVAGNTRCSVVPGAGAAVIIRGDVLAGDGNIYEDGSVLIDGGQVNGTIQYVGCDPSGVAGASTATVITCPGAAISPGLINAHDHLTFNASNAPAGHGNERYNHRHDWRRGLRGKTEISTAGSNSSTEAVLFSELRHLLAGTTSMAGSGGVDGFVRNLDRTNANGGLTGVTVEYDTFPLGDSSGTLVSSGCNYPNYAPASVLNNTIYLPHVAEGVDAEARNEFGCLNGAPGGQDLITTNTSIVHGVGLTTSDIAQLGAEQGKLVWSPRSNIGLYGHTADVISYRRFGVTIGMGTDWIVSGSMNMLRELACADQYNQNNLSGAFTDEELWAMATRGSAEALGVGDRLGALTPGYIADIAIFAPQGASDWRAVLEANVGDVALVLRGGEAIFGEPALIDALVSTSQTQCETFAVCGAQRALCAVRDTGLTLAQIDQFFSSTYPLFACGTPVSEPSCLPARPNEFTGLATMADADGDGIADAQDNCPDRFNAARPLDNGVQADVDQDNAGDVCDVCPLSGPGSMCPMFDPNDRDSDGVPNAQDNCPFDANVNQTDADNDGTGDVCDQCPNAPNPNNSACPVTIYDVRRGQIPVGQQVTVEGTVTGAGDDGFFIQVLSGQPDYQGVNESGVFVFTRTLSPLPTRGDLVRVDGTVSVFRGSTQLSNPVVTTLMGGASPAPVLLTLQDAVYTGGALSPFEGVLVQVNNVNVTSTASFTQFHEVELAGGGLYIDDILFDFAQPTVGMTYTSLIGPMAFRDFSGNIICVRDASDLN
jgi:cytosine/adenosine deaminase-related metal-dependent hydrolase